MARRQWVAFGRLVRGAVIALLVAGPAAATVPAAAAQGTPEAQGTAEAEERSIETASLDLAAITLVPDDLPDDGYVLVGGRTVDAAAEADLATQYRRGGTAEDIAAFQDPLEDAGFERRYIASLVLPAADDPTQIDARVSSYVATYATSDGAADGFALLEDESAVDDAKDVNGRSDFGDESEITRDVTLLTDEDPPTEAISLDITFRDGNLVAGVTLTDFTGGEPTVREIEALASALVERLDTAVESPGPGLSLAALRVAGDDVETPFVYEVSERRDGESLPLYTESDDAHAERDRGYGEATDVFSLQLELVLAGATADVQPFYYTELLRFPDADAAADVLADAATRTALNAAYSDVESVAGADDLGDESAAFSYDFVVSEDLVSSGHVIYARVGADLARVQVDGLTAVPLDAVVELAEAQVACLEAGECPDTVEPPAALVDIATANETPEPDDETPTSEADETPSADDETPTAEPEETPDPRDETATAETEETPEPTDDTTAAADDTDIAAGVNGDSYVGPTFGVAIEWDGDVWEVEDERGAEDYDALQLGTPRSTVFLKAYPRFSGDAADCLADATDEIADRNNVSGVATARRLDPPVPTDEAGEAALLIYDLELDNGETVEVVEYVECRTVTPGESVVEITWQVGADDYEDELPLVEDLLATIELPDSATANDETPTSGEGTPTVSADEAGVNGNAYVGPTYGVELTWDADVWEVERTDAADEYDGLALGTALTTVFFESYAGFDGDPAACLAAAASQIESEDIVSDFGPDRDAAVPDTGAGRDAESEVYRYTVTLENGNEVEVLEYIECRPLVADEAVMEIGVRVGARNYDDELPLVEDLLAELVVPDAEAATDEPSTDDSTPAADFDLPPGQAGYQSPSFGFLLTWTEGEDGWEIEDQATDEGADVVTLGNGVSTVDIEAAPDPEQGGSAVLCLLDAGAEADESPLLGDDGRPVVEIEGDARAFAAFRSGDGDEIRTVECRTLVPGEAILRIVHTAPADVYEDEAVKVVDLLADLTLDEA